MCSHAYANKEEGAPGQFTPPPLGMGISWWPGRAEGVEKELKAGPSLGWWHLRAIRAVLRPGQGWEFGHKQLGAMSLGLHWALGPVKQPASQAQIMQLCWRWQLCLALRGTAFGVSSITSQLQLHPEGRREGGRR